VRVLIIDDEPDFLRLLAQALEEDGYAVETAADGATGLDKADAGGYDAVVLGSQLPSPGDRRRLAELRRSRTLPVLVLTDHDGLADPDGDPALDADGSLIKPFTLAELCARLRGLVQRANDPGLVLHLGDIEVDTRSHQVSRYGQVVPLTAREYILVERLALRRGQVVSQSELHDHFLAGEDDGLPDLLDLQVASIRRKLGPNFIESRPGLGYVIAG
jgi:two-component system OmpR family response regulator